MKNTLKIIFLLSFLPMIFWSCKKDEYKDYYQGGIAPVLTASVTALNLLYANAANEAIDLKWTNPGYSFTTGVSSQDVNYLVEIDTSASFTNSKRKQLVVSKSLEQSITIGDFNDYLLNQLILKPGISYNLYIRVSSYLGSSSSTVALASNVLKVTATPYSIPPKVAVPTTGKLFLVGGPDCLPDSWNPPTALPFTKIDSVTYSITVAMKGGDNTVGSDDQYLFLPAQTWDYKYACMDNTTQSADGGDFGFNENGNFTKNFPGPTAAGTYKIVVDFQHGKYTVTKQ